jgi:Peptidase propeptide and YPEB domain
MKIFATLVKAAALAAVLLAAPAAFASEKIDPAVKDKIAAQLTKQGYDVRKIQMEDGKFEVYAVKDGKTMELYLDDKFNIIKNANEGAEESEGSEG